MTVSWLLAVAVADPSTGVRSPLVADDQLEVGVLGGVDRWTDEGGGAGGLLRMNGYTQRLRKRTIWGGGLGAELEMLPGSTLPVSDAYVVQVDVRRLAVVQPGIGAEVRAAAAGVDPWLETTVAPSLGWSPLRGSWLTARGGAVYRVQDAASGLGAYGGLSAGWAAPGGRAAMEATGEVQTFSGERLPDTVSKGSLRVRIHPALWEVDGGGSAQWAGSSSWKGDDRRPDKAEAIAGLPPPESGQAGAWIGLGRQLVSRVSVRLESGVERGWGTVEYTRGRAFLGCVVSLGPQRRMPGLAAEGPVSFEIAAPRATRVEIMGSFSNWEPVEMRRRRSGRWGIELPLDPGEYEYAYVIDGVVTTPPEAVRRRSDGFGGENGVMVVSSSPHR